MSISKPVLLLLGSNMNNPGLQLKKARNLITQYLCKIQRASSVYKTAPWGMDKQAYFLNQVIRIYSARPAATILGIVKNIELLMGRTKIVKWGPRVIDIDILFYGNEIYQSETLQIPHPKIADRRFTLAPLSEICPRLKHPVTGLTVRKLLEICPDNLSVQKIN